jgi:hypothetical protein
MVRGMGSHPAELGYNEVARFRQAGKSLACIGCFFLDRPCACLIASH